MYPESTMAARALEIPTQEQCFALSDEQCRRIQDLRDPEGVRNYKNWELQHQPELIRLYMTMLSFPHIEQAMRSKLDWSYKTYANRFKDWRFPVDRAEREQVVTELFSIATSSNPQTPAIKSPPEQSMLPIRAIPRYPPPPTPPPPIPQQRSQYFAPQSDFIFPGSPAPASASDDTSSFTFDRVSISTTGTWASGSGASSVYTYNEDTFSNPRSSVATSISSRSAESQYSYYQRQQLPPVPQVRVPSQPPAQPVQETQPSYTPTAKHDPLLGRWNDLLRVIPCQQNHSLVAWHDESFSSCRICGFSRWHSLMINARTIPIDVFMAAMSHLRDVNRVDYAGNFPIHFLMAAGVAMEYFVQLYQWPNSSAQNVFGQNPLHVLNPQDLGEQLINFLEWFKTRDHPPGLLLTQRDIDCRTPLHTLLQQPLERNLYRKILKTFPYAEHQLRSLDTQGRTCIQMMNEASLQYKSTTHASYEKIQSGISEARLFLSEEPATDEPYSQRYGFHDIARGARGTSYFGFFQCRICALVDAHSNSYLDQIKCACKNGRDRNAPDETGMTPAHSLITQSRCNNDGEQTPESPTQIGELVAALIPRDDPTLREALHVLDPEGHSLVWNVSVRGYDGLLAYLLSVEEKSRRRSMVNCCATTGPEGAETSVLGVVVQRLRDVRQELRLTELTGNRHLRRVLVERGNRFLNVRKILVANGAVTQPSITVKWRIC